MTTDDLRSDLLRECALDASRGTASDRRVWLATLSDDDLDEVVSLVGTDSALSALSPLAGWERSERLDRETASRVLGVPVEAVLRSPKRKGGAS